MYAFMDHTGLWPENPLPCPNLFKVLAQKEQGLSNGHLGEDGNDIEAGDW
jgi:hypothetical protein